MWFNIHKKFRWFKVCFPECFISIITDGNLQLLAGRSQKEKELKLLKALRVGGAFLITINQLINMEIFV